MNRILTAALIASGFLLAGFAGQEWDTWPRNSFTAAEWERAPDGARYVFVNDILTRRLLKGKTVHDVQQLLGDPSFNGLKEPDHYLAYIVKRDAEDDFNELFILDIRFDAQANSVKNAFVRVK